MKQNNLIKLVAVMAAAWLGSLVVESLAVDAPPVPKAVAGTEGTNGTKATYFVAATAYDAAGLESDYSNEVTVTNASSAVLSWNASLGTNVAGYQLYYGTNSRAYTKSRKVGTNTTANLIVLPTNVVVTVRPVWATNLAGPWNTLSNWPAFSVTNGDWKTLLGLTNAVDVNLKLDISKKQF